MSKHVSFALLPVTQVTQTIAFPIPFAQLSYGFTSSPPMQQARQYSSFSAIPSALHFTAIQFNSIQSISIQSVQRMCHGYCTTLALFKGRLSEEICGHLKQF